MPIYLIQFWHFLLKTFGYGAIFITGVFTLIGAIVTIKSAIESVPILRQGWVDFWKWWAERTENKENVKYAIKADIENMVNSVTENISKELPKEWMKKVNIKWLNGSLREGEDIQNNQIILRMKALKNQDDNIINATHYFFKTIIFPNTKTVIPPSVYEASALKITQKVISSERPALSSRFTTELLENNIQKNNEIAKYFGKFGILDKRGFFTSFFVRQVDELAQIIRANEHREKIGEEIDTMLEHVVTFSDIIYKKGEDFTKDEYWIRKGFTSYAFLLVAKEYNNNIETYVRKAKLHQSNGIKRLYVMGRSGRIPFTKKVIGRIAKSKGFRCLGVSKLSRDYKGVKGGVGAVFDIL